jgi:hypothetical protein
MTVSTPPSRIRPKIASSRVCNKLLGNPSERSELETVVIGGPDGNQLVTFESYAPGYIGLDDWTQLDPAALLAAIKSKHGNRKPAAPAARRRRGACGQQRQPLISHRRRLATPARMFCMLAGPTMVSKGQPGGSSLATASRASCVSKQLDTERRLIALLCDRRGAKFQESAMTA